MYPAFSTGGALSAARSTGDRDAVEEADPREVSIMLADLPACQGAIRLDLRKGEQCSASPPPCSMDTSAASACAR